MMVVNNDLSDIEKSYMFDSPVSTDHSTPGQKGQGRNIISVYSEDQIFKKGNIQQQQQQQENKSLNMIETPSRVPSRDKQYESLKSPTPNPKPKPIIPERQQVRQEPLTQEFLNGRLASDNGGRKVSDNSDRLSLKRPNDMHYNHNRNDSNSSTITSLPSVNHESKPFFDPHDILEVPKQNPLNQESISFQKQIQEKDEYIKLLTRQGHDERDKNKELEREIKLIRDQYLLQETKHQLEVDRLKFENTKAMYEISQLKDEIAKLQNETITLRSKTQEQMQMKPRFDDFFNEITPIVEEKEGVSHAPQSKEHARPDVSNEEVSPIDDEKVPVSPTKEQQEEEDLITQVKKVIISCNKSTQTNITKNQSTQTEPLYDNIPDDAAPVTTSKDLNQEEQSPIPDDDTIEIQPLQDLKPNKYPEFSLSSLDPEVIPYYKALKLDLVDELSARDKEYLIKKLMSKFMIKFDILDESIQRFSKFILICYDYLNRLHQVVYPGHKLKCSDYYRGRAYRNGKVDEEMIGLQECLEGMIHVINDSLHGVQV